MLHAVAQTQRWSDEDYALAGLKTPSNERSIASLVSELGDRLRTDEARTVPARDVLALFAQSLREPTVVLIHGRLQSAVGSAVVAKHEARCHKALEEFPWLVASARFFDDPAAALVYMLHLLPEQGRRMPLGQQVYTAAMEQAIAGPLSTEALLTLMYPLKR